MYDMLNNKMQMRVVQLTTNKFFVSKGQQWCEVLDQHA
jgi:hypothetical protein